MQYAPRSKRGEIARKARYRFVDSRAPAQWTESRYVDTNRNRGGCRVEKSVQSSR
jgi:hypothetical protein